MTRRAPSFRILTIAFILIILLSAEHASRPSEVVAAPPLPNETAVPAATETPEPVVDHNWPGDLRMIEPDYLVKSPLLHTEVSKRPRNEIVSYRVIGGDTVIGHHAVIGSSVWLTHSVPPYTAVSLEKPSLRIKAPGSHEQGLLYQI